MEISFIHMQILVLFHVNKTNFHMKGFTLGLFKTEVKGNSEIAFYMGFYFVLQTSDCLQLFTKVEVNNCFSILCLSLPSQSECVKSNIYWFGIY